MAPILFYFSATCPQNVRNNNQLPCAKLTVIGQEKCYCFSTLQETWDMTRNFCELSPGFDLVALESAAEERAIIDYLAASDGNHSNLFKMLHLLYNKLVLLGLCSTCLQWTSGIWSGPLNNYYWSKTGSAFNYTNWFQTQPDLNVNGACTAMESVGQCTLRRQFIREK
jgi:hypothetical protein